MDADTNQALATALVTILTPLALALLKRLLPQIPKNVLPVLAPLVGVLVDGVANTAATHVVGTPVTSPAELAATAGLAGVGLREALDQVFKRWESVQTARSRKAAGG